jgi:hypothetical protein
MIFRYEIILEVDNPTKEIFRYDFYNWRLRYFDQCKGREQNDYVKGYLIIFWTKLLIFAKQFKASDCYLWFWDQ